MHCLQGSVVRLLFCVALVPIATAAGPKTHVITFGKWTAAQWFRDSQPDVKPVALKIRALVIDGRTKEYMIGAPHEVTAVCSWCGECFG